MGKHNRSCLIIENSYLHPGTPAEGSGRPNSGDEPSYRKALPQAIKSHLPVFLSASRPAILRGEYSLSY